MAEQRRARVLPSGTTEVDSKEAAAEARMARRSATMAQFEMYGTALFGIVAAGCVVAGDPMLERLEIFFAWLLCAALSVVLRKSQKLEASSWLLGIGAFATFAAWHWLSGALLAPLDVGMAVLFVMAWSLAGRPLALAVAAAALANAVAMAVAAKGGWAPHAAFGSSEWSRWIEHAGSAVLAALAANAMGRRLAMSAKSEEGMMLAAAAAAADYVEIFMRSPVAMVVVEVDRRATQMARRTLTEEERRIAAGTKPRILAINDSFAKLFDVSPKNRGGTPTSVADLWSSPEDYKALSTLMTRTGSFTGQKAFLETWGRKKKLVCLCNASPSRWSGESAVLWTFQDVTEIELLRYRLEKQNVALGEELAFSANQARVDQLTKLPNRRALEENMAKIDARGSGHEVCALMLDVDCFKKYNDSLGHPAGDGCLVAIGECMAKTAKSFGEGAFAARYGGEEFVMILDGFSEKKALEAAWTLCRNIERMGLAHPANSASSVVTVSAGVSGKSQNGSLSEAFKRADLALYASKTSGRNKASLEPGDNASAGSDQ